MMQWVRCGFVAFLVLALTGCAFMDTLAGIKRNGNGEVVEVDGNSVGGIATGLLAGMGGAAGVAGGVLGWALKAYRHKRIVDSGGKDDNFDGIPDPEPPKEIKTTTT